MAREGVLRRGQTRPCEGDREAEHLADMYFPENDFLKTDRSPDKTVGG